MYNSGTGGYVSGNNAYSDKYKAEYFPISSGESIQIEGAYIKFAYATGIGNCPVSIWSSAGGTPQTKLAEIHLSIPDINSDVANNLTTLVSFDSPVTVSGGFFIAVELPVYTGDTIAIYTNHETNAYSNTAWEMNSSDQWIPYSTGWGMSLNHKISAITCLQTNMSEVENNHIASLYPNPANDQVIIDLKNSIQGPIHLNVYNSYSQCVDIQKLDTHAMKHISINTSSYRNGLYLRCIN
ncbi:MAG: hypothetical protein C0594_16850 [Marinilabiliales bacterium]|nr:MAG: hypothetical protein C0594_16850 [Marinilabiliales bacterium]